MKPATNRIKKGLGKIYTMYLSGDVDDIVNTILHADKLAAPFTKDFAESLRGADDLETLKNIWSFTRREIEYVKDKPGHEIVKSPGQTWKDRKGDCKSHTVFIGSILKNLGYPYIYRVAFYDRKNPEQGHIYAIAILPDGRRVVVDSVNDRFNHEHTYWKKKDYPRQPAEIGAIKAPSYNWILWLLASWALLKLTK